MTVFLSFLFLSDEGPMLETLDYTIRIGSTPTFLYFDLYLYTLPTQHTTFIFKANSFHIAKFMFYRHHQLLPSPFLNLFVTNSQVHNYNTRLSVNYRSHACRINVKEITILQVKVLKFVISFLQMSQDLSAFHVLRKESTIFY